MNVYSIRKFISSPYLSLSLRFPLYIHFSPFRFVIKTKMNIESSTIIPSSDSFQFYIPLTSTPKRSIKSSNLQPLCSTLAMSMESTQQIDLSLSAITSPARSHRRRTSTIIKRIELKYLLYSTRSMKVNRQRHYKANDRKIYVV